MIKQPKTKTTARAPRRHTETRQRRRGDQAARAVSPRQDHELEVRRLELELHNEELQKARDQLEVTLGKYTDLYDFTPVGYFSVDESGRILEANLRSAALLGVERSRFVNRRFLAFVAPPSQPTFLIFLDKIVAGTADQSCELRLLKEDGGTFWAGFRAAPAVGPAGGRKWCRVAFEDISDRKQVEETLRESEKRYRTLFELFPVAVYSCDAAGVIQEFNRRAAELWGREPVSGETDERFCGSFKLFRPDGSFMPHEQCPMAEVIRGEVPAVHDGEVLIERPEGSRINALVNIHPLRNGRGEVMGAINCFYDITERKQAEEMLRRNEALFSALVAQAPVGLYVVDAQLRLIRVNPTAQSVFRKVRPLIGRDFSEIIHILWPKKVADQIMKRFRHTLKTGAPYRSPDFAERRRDIGVKQIYEWQIQRVTLPAGEYGVVCFFSNITERKRAEGAQRRLAVMTASNQRLEHEIVRRQQVQDSLRQSEQHQSTLLKESQAIQERLRKLSHQILHAQEEERGRISRELHDEIAQTLVGTNAHLEALILEAEANPRGITQKIRRTQRLVQKSVDLVHQFARKLRPAALDDLGLIPALHTFMDEFTKRTGIQVRFTTFTSGRIPQLSQSMSIVFYRVAQEALTNVARHARASLAEVNFEKLPDAFCLQIKDHGKSFPATRALHPKQNSRLGILGMRERLEMVGGSFKIESSPGKGTVVQARIPLANCRVGSGGGGGGD